MSTLIALPAGLAMWIIRRAQRTPFTHLRGYMQRWWLFGGSSETRDTRTAKERGWKGSWLDALIGRFIAARVHHILRSDNDRHLHDHPFNFLTVVLRGGYWEVTPLSQDQDPALDGDPGMTRKVWHGPGSIIRRHVGDRHRLVLPEGCTAWTLFFMSRRAPDEWGFYTPLGRIPNALYARFQALPTERERMWFAWHYADRNRKTTDLGHWNCRSTTLEAIDE